MTPVRLEGVDTGSAHYALGHNVDTTPEGVTLVFHAGGNPGLRALFIVAPDPGHGFFAVANNDRGGELLAALLRAWGEHYGWTLDPYF